VEEFWKSVYICQSYYQTSSGILFWDTVYFVISAWLREHARRAPLAQYLGDATATEMQVGGVLNSTGGSGSAQFL